MFLRCWSLWLTAEGQDWWKSQRHGEFRFAQAVLLSPACWLMSLVLVVVLMFGCHHRFVQECRLRRRRREAARASARVAGAPWWRCISATLDGRLGMGQLGDEFGFDNFKEKWSAGVRNPGTRLLLDKQQATSEATNSEWAVGIACVLPLPRSQSALL